MKILVTGCCGFIGYHVTQGLIKLGHEVIGIDNMNNYYDLNLKKKILEKIRVNKKFKFFKINIKNKKKN